MRQTHDRPRIPRRSSACGPTAIVAGIAAPTTFALGQSGVDRAPRRRTALELFAELRALLALTRAELSIHMLWFKLLRIAGTAHREGDIERLARLDSFADGVAVLIRAAG
jgi:hypothetical protein